MDEQRTTDTSPDAETEDHPITQLTGPVEIATYLNGIFMDKDHTHHTRTVAANGLACFWMGCELNRVAQVIESVELVPLSGPPSPQEKML